MIRRLYALCPNPGILIRLTTLTLSMAILQGLLLGCLHPIFHFLMEVQPDFQGAKPWLIFATAGLLVYMLLAVIASPVGFAACMQLASELRHHLMEHITRLPLGWFSTERKARLARAMTADIGNIAQLAVTIGAPAITAIAVPVTITLVTIFIDWRMALLFAGILPFTLFALVRAGRIAAIADAELEEAATEIAGRAIEFGQSQSVLRAAGKSVTGSDSMRQALDVHRVTYRRGLRKSLFPDLGYTGTVIVGFISIVAFCIYNYLQGTLEIVNMIVLLVLGVRFLEPLGSLIDLIGALRAMDNAINRVHAILNVSKLPEDRKAVKWLDQASIVFDQVSFSYGTKEVLRNLSFKCKSGTTTALVGASGSGKTTLIRLIARFFDVDKGAIKVGDVDVRKISQHTLMDQIAIIFQDVYLFDMTIEENLRIARPGATAEEFAEAARLACLDEMIQRLPEGWKTRVGEGGAKLSGGEKQRVSIARAFLKNARIVLIDEASSALDPENERAIGEAIANLTRSANRTVIVIAHRPTTLSSANQVVVLDKGEIAELGDPDELIEQGGIYARLYNQYEQARKWKL